MRSVILSVWAIFCPLTLLTTQKIKSLKKWKRHLEILSFYSCVPQIKIMWCMFTEIKWKHVCFLRYGVWFWTYGVSFWTIFCPFTPPPPLKNQKIKTLKKKKKKHGDIIILHKFTINDNHIMYGSWDLKHNRQNFWSFWGIFCNATPLRSQKIKIL